MLHILTIANIKNTQYQEHAWPHGLEIEISIPKSKPFQTLPKHVKNPNLEIKGKKNLITKSLTLKIDWTLNLVKP